MFSREVQPWHYDRIFEVANRENIRVPDIHHVILDNEGLSLVTDHDYVAFASPCITEKFRNMRAVFRPLDHEEVHLRTSLLMRADNTSRLTNTYARSFIRNVEPKYAQRNLFQDVKMEIAS